MPAKRPVNESVIAANAADTNAAAKSFLQVQYQKYLRSENSTKHTNNKGVAEPC